MADSSGGRSVAEINLSVEETNKLREKLGLKPLQVDSSTFKGQRGDSTRQGGTSSANVSDFSSSDAGIRNAHEHPASDKQPTSGEATAEARRRAARSQREKLEEAKRKAAHATFTQGLTIAEQQRMEDDDCDPAAWIARMRRKEAREKVVLASQGKLDVARYDSDEEDASSALRIAARRQEDDSASRRDDGDRKSGASTRKRGRGGARGDEQEDDDGKGGVRVVHGLKEIQEGEDVILTLQDTRILTAEGDLNEDLDALESVQLMEKQRLQKRLKTKARKGVYDPTAEEEAEDTEGGGEKKENNILKHYDEWEEEQLQAQGKPSRKEQATGFILPNIQEHGLPEVVEVPLHRLKAPDRSHAGHAGGTERPGESRGTREGEGTESSARRGIQYDASGPSCVVLGQEFDARKEEEAEKPVTFRKVSKKKISKKKHGSDFWKDLFADSLADRNGEEEVEEGEADLSGDEDKSAAKHQKKDRHHGSRKGRAADDTDRRAGAQQKQSVRDALERAAETAHKQRADSSPPSAHSRLQDAQRKSTGGGAAREDSAGLPPRRRDSDGNSGSERLHFSSSSGATANAVGDEPDLSHEDEMLLEEDRLLQEQLERQRRLARAKLLEQSRSKLKVEKDDEDKESLQPLHGGEDTTLGSSSLAFRKLPHARLLELLSRAQRGEAALIDARPKDTAGGAESSLRGGARNSCVQQQNSTGASTAGTLGAASVGSIVKGEEEAEEEEGGGLQISTTTEFCRTVQTPLEKLQTMKQEVFAGARLFRQQKAAQTQGRGERGSKTSKGGISGASSLAASGSRRDRRADSEGEEPSEAEGRGMRGHGKKQGKPTETGLSGGEASEEMEVDEDKGSAAGDGEKEKQIKAEDDEGDDADELEDVAFMNETPMGQGIAETLKYLQSKNHYSLDKMRQRRHRPDELPLHKPIAPNEIKIDHRDMYGNVMTPKDAFRQISWRFHGKYPSLNKQEKQARKMHLERKLLKNPMEALPTLNALQKLQQTEKAFHMVLTGGSLGEGGGSR